MNPILALCGILSVCYLISGCTTDAINANEINKATQFCSGSTHGGIDYILIHDNRDFDHVVCNDGTQSKIIDIDLSKIGESK